MIHKRGVRAPFILVFLLAISAAALVYGGCPLLTHQDPSEQREFSNVCQQIQSTVSVTIGSGVPAIVPKKVGDEYVDTTNHKIYFATSTVTSGGWLIVN
jgi:hypothetical protein